MRHSEGTSESTSGFTLIEVLVALVIFVTGYILVHQSVSLAWRGAQLAWAESAAVRLAQSQLAAAGVATELREGEEHGEAQDGLRWTVRIERYQRADADAGAQKLVGYWVTVTVRWHGGALRPDRSLQLRTLKLGPGA
jgi:prepilin-type N-terminal cleavage/methylation domain-containing protein